MCGIAGFFGNDNWREKICLMNKKMIHRGPDDQRYWHNDEFELTLGHVRLSILDLSEAGSQPMLSHDGRYAFIFNGEIYNHEEMKFKLMAERRRILFNGYSDTEILLEYICAFGIENALQDSIGMFAWVLFDMETRELYFARDRMGEKPLFYGVINGSLYFASDLGSIFEVERDSLSLDRNALALYFAYGYIPAPYSIYKEVKKLRPGCYARVVLPYDIDNIQEICYWDIKSIAKKGTENPFTGTYDEAVARLDQLLHKAIKRQMVADVPVGAFLSGGIDSSTVVSIMQDISDTKIKTFSIGFNEDTFNEAYYSKQIANHIGTDHTELYISSKDAIDVIPLLPGIYSEPFADPTQMATYLVSKLAKRQVTVSLSGDGGDELFCGYRTYFDLPNLYERVSRFPESLRKTLSSVLKEFLKTNNRYFEAGKRYLGVSSVEDIYKNMSGTAWSCDILSIDNLPDNCLSDYEDGFLTTSCEQNLMLMDMIFYHPNDILVNLDRAAMAVSLESRVPLLDKDIIEFAWTLPIDMNKKDGIGKNVLRSVLYRYVPREMMERPKKGFSIPISEWIRSSELKRWGEEHLSENKIKREGILNHKEVSRTWKYFLKTGMGERHIWRLLMFEEWVREYM